VNTSSYDDSNDLFDYLLSDDSDIYKNLNSQMPYTLKRGSLDSYLNIGYSGKNKIPSN
jgi:hypothetical protein